MVSEKIQQLRETLRSKKTGTKTKKVLNRAFTAFSIMSVLTFIGLVPSQAELPKTGMLLGQTGNSELSAFEAPKVSLLRCVWVFPPGFVRCS